MKLLTTTLLTLLTILFTGTASALPTDIEYTPLAERQVGCSQMLPCAQLEGDGDPHQVVLHKRLSLVALCDASAPCALSDSEPVQRSYIIQADTHGTQWTSGGFAVVESVQTGTHPCVGGPGQRVCAFAAIWHTEYTVRAGNQNQCSPDTCQTGDTTTVVRAPNALHDGNVEYFCAFDSDCGDMGQEIWRPGPDGPPPVPAPLTESKPNCLPAGSCTALEGSGDPHQWILHKQLSSKVDCGDEVCGVSDKDQEDYTIIADTHGSDWISGDLEVEESIKTGTHLGCEGGGDQPGRTVCVYAVIWHTDYTVHGGVKNWCDLDGCIQDDMTRIIRAPNKITHGVEYYCAWDDACGEQGEEIWIAAAAGGPPSALDKRQCGIGHRSVLEGDGAPKQMILRKQISNHVVCAEGPCSVKSTAEASHEVKWRVEPEEDIPWIDGGFDVEKSVDTGILEGDLTTLDGETLYECQGQPYEAVCIIADIWHTAYTVRGHYDRHGHNCLGGSEPADHTNVMISPNKIDGLVSYWCGHNAQCGEIGDEYLVGTEVSGGPPVDQAVVRRGRDE